MSPLAAAAPRAEAGVASSPEPPRSLTCPLSRAPLRLEGTALSGPAGRWPVIDGIPYLRVGRDALREALLRHLDAGEPVAALALALSDMDDWWTGPAPDPTALRALAAAPDRFTLREAMAALRWGRVADYFAHRWSDPTYLAGLVLLDAHAGAPQSVFELACGIGHYGREWQERGVAYAGGDVVFAKLWLAQRFVLSQPARLVCFDAAAPWPLAGPFDLVACHDAFYFLEPKREIAERMRTAVAPGGALLLAHVHNRDAAGFSAGAAMSADEVEALFPDAVAYDDAELGRALVEARSPRAQPLAALRGVEAFSLAVGAEPAARPATGDFALPPVGSRLVRNPLLTEDGGRLAVSWPSERYEAEYGPLASYLGAAGRAADDRPAAVTLDDATPAPLREAARRREFVWLPERW